MTRARVQPRRKRARRRQSGSPGRTRQPTRMPTGALLSTERDARRIRRDWGYCLYLPEKHQEVWSREHHGGLPLPQKARWKRRAAALVLNEHLHGSVLLPHVSSRWRSTTVPHRRWDATGASSSTISTAAGRRKEQPTTASKPAAVYIVDDLAP